MPPPSPSSEKPSPAKRVVFFLIFGTIGGVIGYGLVTSGPGPAPSVLEFPGAAWVFGGAAVCGLLAAAWPDGALRRRGEWSRRNRDE
jgi:hypothetical protein